MTPTSVRPRPDTLAMPAASTKPRRRKRAPVKPPDIFGTGSGRMVTLEGERACTDCGRKVSLRFRGASDSLGARLTRANLRKGATVLCEKCIDDADERERQREDRERDAEGRALRLRSSRIPERWRSVTLEDLERDERVAAIDVAQEWATEPNARGLLLHGRVGRGKTVIAGAAAMLRLDVGHVRWLGVADLMTKLRMSFDSPEYKSALRAIEADQARGALVLDDLDKVPVKDHQLQPLYVAINNWIEGPLPLLVTMNRSPEQLRDWAGENFGEALASRLVGYCRTVEVVGRDRRLD